MRAVIAYRFYLGDARRRLADDLWGLVCAAVIDDDDFVRDGVQCQFEVKVLECACDAALLVKRRYDHREQSERRRVAPWL